MATILRKQGQNILGGGGGDATGRAKSETIAPIFDTSVSYAVGEAVMYDDKRYVCTTAHAAGAWNAEHFTEDSLLSFKGTQSEWNALTTAQKEKYDGKLIVITDDVQSGQATLNGVVLAGDKTSHQLGIATESNLGTVELYSTAQNAHDKGTYFIDNSGQFVMATEDIDMGDTIDSSNTENKNVALALKDQNDVNDTIDAITDVYGSKNLNSYPYYETTKTINGITFTDNRDGTITVNGTAEANCNMILHTRLSAEGFKLKNGTYIISGCPNNGSVTTFYLNVEKLTKESGSTSAITVGEDYGNGLTFTIDGDNYNDGYTRLNIEIVIMSGTNITTPITFKPMIRDARISDDTYVPYAMTNRELTSELNSNLNNIAEYVNIASYTIQNKYITPSCGYAWIYKKAGNTGQLGINVFSANGSKSVSFAVNADSSGLYAAVNSLYIKKGMQLCPFGGIQEGDQVTFNTLRR